MGQHLFRTKFNVGWGRSRDILLSRAFDIDRLMRNGCVVVRANADPALYAEIPEWRRKV
jgi:hypothetical protein